MKRESVEIEGICKSLREIRRVKSLSLSDVEELSNGALKAVVLGSYERGTRSLSVRRAIQIAHLYEVPLEVLLTGQSATRSYQVERTMIDLRRVRSLNGDMYPSDELSKFESLRNYLKGIALMRNDWNGEVISLRGSDIQALALLAGGEYEEYLSWLSSADLILKKKSS
jgi:transcriptional regulator with XRE-family HTH domain